jgi:hypothetical protein
VKLKHRVMRNTALCHCRRCNQMLPTPKHIPILWGQVFDSMEDADRARL